MSQILQQFFKDKKILITGHTGFKGSWLTQILLNWGAVITGIALKPKTNNPNLFNILKLQNRINNYFQDIRDYAKIKIIILHEKPEITFHLAAQALVRDSYDDPLYTFETNIIGTANILQAIKIAESIKSGVIITTDKVYADKERNYSFQEEDKLGGNDPYSSSKAAAEMVINSYIKSFFNPKTYKKTHRTLIASVRSGNVIGGGDWSKDRIVPDIVKSIFEKKQPVIIRNPNFVRPWQFVLEPLWGYLLLAKKLYEGKKNCSTAWNFGPKEKSDLTVQLLTKKAIKILNTGSYVIQKNKEKPEAKSIRLNSNKAQNILGWRQNFTLDKTLEFTFAWYHNFYVKENRIDIVSFTDQQIKSFFNHL